MKNLIKFIFNFKSKQDLIGKSPDFWERQGYRTARTIRNIIILAVVVGISSVWAKVYNYMNPIEKTVYAEVDVSDKSLESKIDKLKDNVVDEIMNCESPTYKDSDALITFDPSKYGSRPENIPSLGKMQFKVSTIILHQKTLYNAVLTPKEAVMLALDTDKAKALAKDIMFKTKNKANDWLNCATKFGTNSKIDLIKQIEK